MTIIMQRKKAKKKSKEKKQRKKAKKKSKEKKKRKKAKKKSKEKGHNSTFTART